MKNFELTAEIHVVCRRVVAAENEDDAIRIAEEMTAQDWQDYAEDTEILQVESTGETDEAVTELEDDESEDDSEE